MAKSMTITASTRIPVKAKDGTDGSDGNGVKKTTITYQIGSSGTTAPTGTWLADPPTAQKGKYLWTRTVTVFTNNSETVAYSVSYYGSDGENGANGLPGAVSVKKKWVQGDTPVRDKDIVQDFYVDRGTKAASDWYRLAENRTINSADAPPATGDVPTYYERVTSMMTLQVDAFLANEANVGGFFIKDGVFWSTKGMVADTLVDYNGQEGFVPNIILDGATGEAIINNGEFRGMIVAQAGSIGGWVIAGDVLRSSDGLIEMDAATNEITIKDPDSGAPSTLIRSSRLVANVSGYFGSASSTNIGLSALTGTGGRSVNIKTISSGDADTYQVQVPSIRLTGSATNLQLPNGMIEIGNIMITLGLFKDGKLVNIISSHNVRSQGSGTTTETKDTPATTLSFAGAGVWSLRTVVEGNGSGGALNTSSQNAIVGRTVNRSEIGSNGMVIATNTTNYVFMVGGLFEVRRGQNIFQMSTSQAPRVSKNGGANWTDL